MYQSQKILKICDTDLLNNLDFNYSLDNNVSNYSNVIVNKAI